MINPNIRAANLDNPSVCLGCNKESEFYGQSLFEGDLKLVSRILTCKDCGHQIKQIFTLTDVKNF